MSTMNTTPSTNQPAKRQPRGSINRRACQKCRHLKIKCDGDAENNVPCTNCDYGTCIFDKSPRKNRQVEKLNSRIELLENTLMDAQTNLKSISETQEILKLEKEILNLLMDCFILNLFVDHNFIVFNQLRQAIMESRFMPIFLPVIQTLLTRLSQNDNDSNSIMAMLKSIAENTMNYCSPDNTFNQQNNIEEVLAQVNFNNTITSENVSVEMANLALHSPISDVDSDFKVDNLINVTSPNLISIDQDPYYSRSESEYDNSPVSDYNTMDYTQSNIFFAFPSYGSNSSNQ